MASSWSRSLGIGNYGSQMKVTVRVLSQNRSANTSRVKVLIEAYNGGASRAYNQGSGATVSVSGNGISHSAQVKFNISGRTWFTFADWDFTVSHNADGTFPVNIVGRIADTGTSSLGDGGGVRVQGTADPLYLAPTAPSWNSTAYQNSSRVLVSWNNRSSARGAYSKVRVQRWLRSTGSWSNRALLSGSASSYTDTSIPANNEVRWRVRAEGPGGNSGWVQGGTLGTTPAAATNVRATKSNQGVRVSWTDNAANTNRSRTFYVDDNPGGTGWVRVGSIGGSATSWNHADADPSVTHQYRIWTRITSGINHTSASSDPSNTVQLQAAPNQPSRVGPLDVTPLEVGDTLPLEWSHNPVDTTEQTEAQVQWRLDGGSWTTSNVTGSSNTLGVTPSTDLARAKFEWRVRTKGAHPDWSPWSTTNGPLLTTRPQVVFQSPESGEDLTVSRVLAAWSYEPGGDQSQLQQAEWSAILTLYDSGTPIENAAGTTETEVQLDSRLENQTRYGLQLSVRNGDGLWSEPDVTVFTTNFPLPAVVETFPSWDQDAGSVSIGFGESEELRASYRWAGSPNASVSEAVNDRGLPNMLDPEVSSTQWVSSGGAALTTQPRNGEFPWLPDSITRIAKVDRAGTSGSRYISLASGTVTPAKPGMWYGVAVSIATPEGVKGDLRLQFSPGGTRSSIRADLPPEGGQIAVVGQSQEGDGRIWPVIWPDLSDDPFYVAGAVLVEAESEEEAWEALRRGHNPDVAETNLIENPRFAEDGAYFSVTGRVGHLDGGLVRLECRGATPYLGQTGIPVSPGQWFAFESEFAWDDNGIGRHRHQVQFRGPGGESISAPQTVVDQAEAPDGGRATLVEQVPEGVAEARCYVWGYREGGYASPEVGATHRTGLWHAATAWTEEEARKSVETYFDGDSPGVTDVDAIDVERRQPDGSWLLVASGVSTSTTVVDRTPHIGDVEYRAVSRTVLPTEQEGPSSTAVWVHDKDPVFVNGGEGMDQVCLARGSEATDEHEVDQALHRFAGQDRPTAFFGPGQDHTTSFTGKILPHYHLPTSSRQEWVQLLRQRGLVCFRDCTGRKVFGVLSVGFSQTGNVEQVELSVQEAVYTEGVARVSDLDLEQGETED